MLVFHSAPLPNALLYGMGEYHHFKNSKYCSVSLIMGRHYSKQFTFISSSPHNSPVRYVLLLSLLYRWGTQGREKANNQPKVTELTSSRAGANPRVPAGMHATMAGGGGGFWRGWILKGVEHTHAASPLNENPIDDGFKNVGSALCSICVQIWQGLYLS